MQITDNLLILVGLTRDNDMAELDSQQTAWQTEAVFKVSPALFQELF